jgi:hypothetical protein
MDRLILAIAVTCACIGFVLFLFRPITPEEKQPLASHAPPPPDNPPQARVVNKRIWSDTVIDSLLPITLGAILCRIFFPILFRIFSQ